MPEGNGGTLFPGTYVLTGQIYYIRGGASCSPPSNAQTFTFDGACFQVADGVGNIITSASAISVQGNTITATPTCLSPNLDGAIASPDRPTKTFTATPTTLEIFVNNSAVGNPNPDRMDYYFKQ